MSTDTQTPPVTETTPDPTAVPDVVGRVACPPHKESTSERFFCWVADNTPLECGEVVRTTLQVGGVTHDFFGVVEEVFVQSALGSIAEARHRYDGDPHYDPPFDLPSVTFAEVKVTRTLPGFAGPPADGALVVRGDDEAAGLAFGTDLIDADDRLAVGLVQSGASRIAGRAVIDLADVLGANAGHVNVTGIAGRGTKSSFLLHLNDLLLRKARRLQAERPTDHRRLKVVPIILNVKNHDLFHIDRPSRRYDADEHADEWSRLGIDDPGPFTGVRFLAPQQIGGENPIPTGRTSGVEAYSYSLGDVIGEGLFAYLFAEHDAHDDNFAALYLSIEDWLTRATHGSDGVTRFELRAEEGMPRTFDELRHAIDNWIADKNRIPFAKGGNHHVQTLRKLARRLTRMLHEGKGVLRIDERYGKPLKIEDVDTVAPRVIDLSALSAVPMLQRFVAAAVFQQLVRRRTGDRAVDGLIYLVTLDELNRFAPKGSKDPVTRLIEQVAAEMRSQGIILLGAQQQASLVSTRVITNAGLRVLGHTHAQELSEKVWGSLTRSAKSRATRLRPDEKLLLLAGSTEPLAAKIPFPPWALRREEAVEPGSGAEADLEEP